MSQIETIAATALRLAGDQTSLSGYEPVGGGMISQTARIRSRRGEYLLKWGGQNLSAFFAAEARGLELLASAGALRVPAVLAYHDPESAVTTAADPRSGGRAPQPMLDPSEAAAGRAAQGFILLEWLAAPPHADRMGAFEALGRGLAALHRASAPAYGLDHDNYLGIMPQHNGWMPSWSAFFRERRLRVQGDLARRNGRLAGARARRLDQLLDRLDTWLGSHEPPPALLHGDLWSGNVLIGPGGAPAVIDPAVSYGDREAELAYTALFGGFPEPFYRAYAEAWPLPDGWQERRELYNLYHLLNHLNLFGGGYRSQVEETLSLLLRCP
jgi:fructosamine-3-kinase